MHGTRQLQKHAETRPHSKQIKSIGRKEGADIGSVMLEWNQNWSGGHWTYEDDRNYGKYEDDICLSRSIISLLSSKLGFLEAGLVRSEV